MITNIGDYPKWLLIFFIENIWYSGNGRENKAGYQSLHLKKNKPKTWSKWEHMKQCRQSRFFLFIHFCCGHCLHFPHLAEVYIGTVRCVCKLFSFSPISGCSSTLLEHWQSLSWKSNPHTNWVTASGSPLSQSILSLPVSILVSHWVQQLHQCPQHPIRVWVDAFTRQWICSKYCHCHSRAEDGRDLSGYWKPQHFQCKKIRR